MKGLWWLSLNSHERHASYGVELSGSRAISNNSPVEGSCSVNRPSIVFLSETKNKVKKMEKIRREVGFGNLCYVPPVRVAGGLALWWSDDMNVFI